MNQRHGAGALLTDPPTSGKMKTESAQAEAPRRPRSGSVKPESPDANRTTGQSKDEGRRPEARLLSALTRDYSNRIQESEAKRRRTEAAIIEEKRQRRDAANRQKEAEWQRQEALFQRRVQAAFLESARQRYALGRHDANHTHEGEFLSWANTSGAYPHGLQALTEDWKNVIAGRPVQ